MPQDDTFVTPTTPSPTIPPVQDGGSSDQSFIDPTNTLVPEASSVASTGPTPIDPTIATSASQAPVSTDFTNPTPVDNPTPSHAAPADPDLIDPVPASDTVVMPGPEPTVETPSIPTASSDLYTEVATKIGESKNVLIALSGDPSVDELSAAIGLSLYLDRIGKRATAIYSGSTPNALEFLKPEETFESTADTLQDFVIALNKDKADHLRYKLDGDYVKIYITPYKHRLSEEDLDFSYGDYNVDLVIALDVANGIDLDSALREHGRIMHDAVIVNATTGNPGKFGEIEWSDKTASSVSEMIATLLYNFGGENPVAKDEATAYLTGIVAATNRFANAKTTPSTMRLCSKLMESGANQQLVSKNITPDIDNELINFAPITESPEKDSAEDDPTKLDIEHDYEKREDKEEKEQENTSSEGSDEVSTEVTKKEHTLLDDLKAAEQSLAQAGAETTPLDDHTTLTIESEPGSDATPSETEESPSLPTVSLPESDDAISNPAAVNTPTVPEAPEINGVPEMNFMPMPDQEILPPPPTPPIDASQDLSNPTISTEPTEPTVPTESAIPTVEPEPIKPATPAVEPEPTPLGPQPAMQDQVYRPQASDPSAFQIPGIYNNPK